MVFNRRQRRLLRRANMGDGRRRDRHRRRDGGNIVIIR